MNANTKTRQKYWQHWQKYAANFHQTDAYLRNKTDFQKSLITTAFAARVRTGYYGKGRRVKVNTVQQAVSAITTTIELAGERSPVSSTSEAYSTPMARAMEGWRRNDPPPVAQLAVPVTVPQYLFETTREKSPALQTAGELALIAFFYLLRVGEYTRARTTARNSKRTVNFRVQDVGFYKDGKILSRHSPIEKLLQADACTLKITNQKNGRMGTTIHQIALRNTTTCPVKALAARVHHILSHGGKEDFCICDYWDENDNTWKHVNSKFLINQIRATVLKLNLHNNGIDPDLVGVHSLRAGGAMAMRLHGFSDTEIMKHGRWRSLTFLMYIHNQIAHLSVNISEKMNTPLPFLNIACIEAAS